LFVSYDVNKNSVTQHPKDSCGKSLVYAILIKQLILIIQIFF